MDDRAWYAVTLARISKKRNEYQSNLCAGAKVSSSVAEVPDVRISHPSNRITQKDA
jgi:hypothetical protein